MSSEEKRVLDFVEELSREMSPGERYLFVRKLSMQLDDLQDELRHEIPALEWQDNRRLRK